MKVFLNTAINSGKLKTSTAAPTHIVSGIGYAGTSISVSESTDASDITIGGLRISETGIVRIAYENLNNVQNGLPLTLDGKLCVDDSAVSNAVYHSAIAFSATRIFIDPPLPVTTNLQLHLDANDVTTITHSGGAVSQWDDDSPSENNATQGTGSKQPVYTLNVFGGLPALFFNGSSSSMALDSIPVTGTDPRTVFVVARAEAGTNNGLISFTDDFSEGTGSIWALTAEIGIRYLNSTYIADSDSMIHATDASIATATNAASSNVDDTILYKNGAVIVDSSPSTAAIDTNENGSCTIGDQTNSSNYIHGEIGEILVYDRVLTTDERNSVHTYLSDKWGITLP